MLSIIKSTSTTVSPYIESRDTGWEIIGDYAYHYPCNAGTMKSIGATGLEIGKTYVVKYAVDNVVSGLVRILLGTAAGADVTAAGEYTQTITCTANTTVSFYSNGFLRVKLLSFYELVEETSNHITLAFFEGEGNDKKWSSFYSYEPEMMIRFINSFFTIKGGALWLHNVNPIMNNFYGQQYNSQVQFYDNINPTTVKEYFTIRVQATTPWYSPSDGDISILPVVGLSTGMSSRLKKNNFRNYQGSFYASFMRNMLDGRFVDQEVALYKGQQLRGRFIQIMLTNKDTTPAILYEVDVKSSPASITY